jgi:ATP-dependent protease HslVU (ClpYQ) peptidase subunit
MTTIAWDGTTLAADRRCVRGNTRATTRKLRRLSWGGIVGFSGVAGVGNAMLDWLDNPRHPLLERPKYDREDDWADMLAIAPDGSVTVHEMNGSFPVLDAFWAIGSGAPFALAAMALGKSAREAIEVAARFNVGTGDGIDELTLTV